MRHDRLEGSAEVTEFASTLVHLHALAVVFNLRQHPVRTFPHRHFHGCAGFRLMQLINCLAARSPAYSIAIIFKYDYLDTND